MISPVSLNVSASREKEGEYQHESRCWQKVPDFPGNVSKTPVPMREHVSNDEGEGKRNFASTN
jgi:hypothetical protein